MSEETKQPRRYGKLFAQSLASEIDRLVKPVYKQHGFTEHRVLTEWESVVGKDLAAGSVPKKLTFPKGKREQGTLHVNVNSGARALELQHMQPVILERIATYFGYHAIDKITFSQSAGPVALMKPRRKKMVVKPASPQVSALVAGCEDEALREALSSLGAAIMVTKDS